MKIAIGSDIHLEFGMSADERVRVLENVEADVLLLAGDIDIGRHFKRREESTISFFEQCLSNFAHVIYVMGNHEHYHHTFNETESVIREALPEGVKFLQNQKVEIDGISFLGTSLWTDCNKGDYFCTSKLQQAMSDYKVIKYKDADGNYRKLRPSDTILEHRLALRFLKENITEGCVVVTHHLPTFKSVNPIYANQTAMNGGYASDLSEMMLALKPKIWVHGHTHDECEYIVGDTTVHCNPRGYFGEQPTSEFQLKVFEI